MLGRRPKWLAGISAAVGCPGLGPVLYALNLSRPMIRRMAAGHVDSDPEWCSGDRLAAKLEVARSKGARFASVRFVTGALDPFLSPESALAAAVTLPPEHTLWIWGEETPRRSRAAMEALATPTSTTLLPQGKLALHEEFPAQLAPILP